LGSGREAFQIYIDEHCVPQIQPFEHEESVLAATYWHFVGSTTGLGVVGVESRLMRAFFHQACRGSIVHFTIREGSFGGYQLTKDGLDASSSVSKLALMLPKSKMSAQ
jgi:hypothetical protein